MRKLNFTLIEVLLVVVIIATVLTFIAPAFRIDRVESSFIKLKNMIERTRQLAVTERKEMSCIISIKTVLVDTESLKEYTIKISDDISGNRQNGDSFAGTKEIALNENIEFVTNTTTITSSYIIAFDKKGQLMTSLSHASYKINTTTNLAVRDLLNQSNLINFYVTNFTGKVRRK